MLQSQNCIQDHLKMEWSDPTNGDSVSLHLEPLDIAAGINLARSPRYSEKGENLQT